MGNSSDANAPANASNDVPTPQTSSLNGNETDSRDDRRSTQQQQPPRSVWEHDWADDNPFTLFRRYADEQISSMLQAVVGLPSTFEPPAAGNWLYFEEQGPTVLARAENTNTNGTQSDGNSQDSKRDESKEPSWYDAGQSKPLPREDTRDNSRQDTNDDRTRRSSLNDLLEDTRHWLGRPLHVSFFDSPLLDWPLRSSAWIYDYFFPHPHFFDSIISSHGPGWALPYILFSPYSPIHLERNERRGCKPRGQLESWFGKANSDDTPTDTPTTTPDWRLAFEDLLRIEAGKSMLNVSSKEMFKKESGADWIYGMIDRGSLGDQWKLQRRKGRHGEDLVSLSYQDERSRRNWEASSSRRNIKNGDSDATNGAAGNDGDYATELDMYETTVQETDDEPKGLLGKGTRSFADMIEEKAKAIKNSALSRVDKKSDTDESRPAKVISTSISTERRTMPDGSVHSKSVRTKRYSDGHEEKSEWVETTNPRDGTDGDDSNGGGRDSWF